MDVKAFTQELLDSLSNTGLFTRITLQIDPNKTTEDYTEEKNPLNKKSLAQRRQDAKEERKKALTGFAALCERGNTKSHHPLAAIELCRIRAFSDRCLYLDK